ncbi:MAG: esterase-like activity of phytase family protein [Pseudomonadota bacterium]
MPSTPERAVGRALILALALLLPTGAPLAEPAAALDLRTRPTTPPTDPAAAHWQAVAGLEILRQRGIGGFSSVLRSTEPERLLLASDRGFWVDVAPVRDATGALVGLADARRHAGLLPPSWSQDVEGMAWVDGDLVVSTEGGSRGPDRILRFDDSRLPAAIVDSRDLQALDLGANRGLEALADLPDGGWFAVAETRRDGGFVAVDDRGHAYRYQTEDGFVPTGADRIGDRLVLVERSLGLLSGWRARVVCLELDALRPGAVLAPVVLARLDGAGIDNMEGIAVWPQGDDVEVLLVSDDNLAAPQRTLLLHYRWQGGASGGCGTRPHQQAEG